MKLNSVNDLELYRKRIVEKQRPDIPVITVCRGTGCTAFGSEEIINEFTQEIKKKKLSHKVAVKRAGCHGFCERGPIVLVLPDEIFYQQVQKEDVREILESVVGKKILTKLLYTDSVTNKKYKFAGDIPFYKRQSREVLMHNGRIDPESIEDYILTGGYSSLSRVLSSMNQTLVIEEMKKSGLRGRGGAGFLTGLKWELAHQAKGEIKYIICNADEGDPGAFMDRSVLEGNPHSVIEGILIAGYAIGAQEGYIYVRAEYPLAVYRLNKAIEACEKIGLIGENILGSDYSFKIKIKEGAGAFVCGEETALIASIEGKRGMPRSRPPFPANSGLWGKPTCINNVESLANVPLIILSGGEEYSKTGTEKSKGTKIFSLTGKINNTGLVEVPLGMELGDLIYEIGGGIPKEREFKAVQTGGPSGGCIPPTHLSLAIDYESLTSIGSIMGSGGMIVVDKNTCMVELSRYFLSFTQSESCGKCTPCRIGTKRMLEILTRITEGKGEDGDIDKLLELATFVKDTSLCGLGQTAPNPVISTIRFFREEYEEHIQRKYCPAAQCKELIVAPCNNTCPGGVDVSGYIQLIREEKFEDADNLITSAIPFPSVCGRVCYHPCEIKCRRGDVDEPIAINALKRFVSDFMMNNGKKLKKRTNNLEIDKKVAVVGSGPCGLTCAYVLRNQGIGVTVFEAQKNLGGMLRYGIPEYRLPRRIIDYEIKRIVDSGIKVETNKILGKNLKLKDLEKKFDAIFLAVGCHTSQKLNIKGENKEGVFHGIEFLREVNQGKKVELGKEVLVVGGGNVAIDAARVARRYNKKVTVVYRRSKEQMPAHAWEIEEAEREGVKFIYLLSPLEIKGDKRIKAVKFQSMKLGNYDASGRRRPVKIEDSYEEIRGDSLIVAIGQRVNFMNILGEDIETSSLGETNKEGIFAGGDAATGPGMVIEAIGFGKKAANSIIKYLRGEKIQVEEYQKKFIFDEEYLKKEEPSSIARQKMKCLNVQERIKNFKEVDLSLSKKQAILEAQRCLQCHLER